jgi:hypothetical protein
VRGLVERNLPGYVSNLNFVELMHLMYIISFHGICILVHVCKKIIVHSLS